MQETISESWKSVLLKVQFEPATAQYISRGVISFYMTGRCRAVFACY